MLVDTSIWIDHLRRGDPALSAALEHGLVVTHPFVVGELAMGNLANRREVMTMLRRLPSTLVATHDEVLSFIEVHSFFDLVWDLGTRTTEWLRYVHDM